MATNKSTETETTAASRLLSNAQIIKDGVSGYPTIYKLQFKEEVIKQSLRLRKCSIGQLTLSSGWHAPEKIIMMVGATGAGKTTMINAFVNYYYGIRWKDNFRLRLITEEDEGINGVAQSQTKSQTKFITAYTLYHQPDCAVPYTLTIIDTPGFGDVEGIERDAEIRNQIREFFMITGPNGIDHLDAVGVVIQNSVNRLTPTQTYIFDSILEIFGKDISSNMFSLITFADGQEPPVLKAIEKANIPSKAYFKFNNSALFAANQSSDEEETNVDEMFWRIGIASLKNFFNKFQIVQSVSLTLTKEVLSERQHLEVFVQGIQPQIQYGLHKLEEIRQEVQVLDKHVNDMLKNKSFEYTIEITKQYKVDLPKGTYVTNCLRCNYTCHYPCGIAEDKEKYRCNAMTPKDQNAQCSVCPNKCSWTAHVINSYQFVLYQESETRTSEDMKKRYQRATNYGQIAQEMVEVLKYEFTVIQTKVIDMIDGARKAIQRLEQIALKPNALSVIQYIELLIETEKNEAKLGWQQRIHHLNEAKQKAEIIQKLKNQEANDLFADSSEFQALQNRYKHLAAEMSISLWPDSCVRK